MENFTEFNEAKEKKKVTTVYFDMDGVLADFEATVKGILGKTPSEIGQEAFKKKYKESLYDRDFLSNIEVMKGAKELFAFARKNFDNVEVLSSAGHYKFEKVKKEKIGWMKEHFGTGFKINIVPKSPDKAKFADENSLLIDDREKAYGPFKKAGGHIIPYKNAKDAIKKLKAYV